MPWLKTSDMAANHPVVVAPYEDESCDDRLINELFGFVSRCALQSAAHMTDYVVSRGTAMSIAGPTRVHELLESAVRAGYFIPITLGDGRTAYKLVEDDEFMHIRSREEVEWERQRKRDNSNPAINVPVRLRDGDACRWCGVVVNWTDRKGARGATYDHLQPKQQSTVETTVVACKACNSSRKDGETPKGITDIMPAPADPYFSNSTIKWLTDSKWRQDQGLPVPKPAAKQVPTGYRVDGTQPPTPDLPQARDARSESRSAPLSRGSTDPDPQSGHQQPSTPEPEIDNAPDGQCPTGGESLQRKQFEPHRQDRDRTTPAQSPTPGHPPDPGPTDICQIPADPDRPCQDVKGSFPDSSGRDGSGRVGPGLVGGPATSGGEGPALISPARRRRRSRKRNKPHNREGSSDG